MYSVFLKEQRVKCPVGWYDEERKKGVELKISVEVWLAEMPEDQDLNEGMDYIKICEIVNREAQIERRLLETLAKAISNKIYNENPNLIGRIVVYIEKEDIGHPQFSGKCCGIKFESHYNS